MPRTSALTPVLPYLGTISLRSVLVPRTSLHDRLCLEYSRNSFFVPLVLPRSVCSFLTDFTRPSFTPHTIMSSTHSSSFLGTVRTAHNSVRRSVPRCIVGRKLPPYTARSPHISSYLANIRPIHPSYLTISVNIRFFVPQKLIFDSNCSIFGSSGLRSYCSTSFLSPRYSILGPDL